MQALSRTAVQNSSIQSTMEGSTSAQSETNSSSPTAKDASVPDSANSDTKEVGDHSIPCPESVASGSSPLAKVTTPGSEASGSSPPARVTTPGSEASGSSPPAKVTTPGGEISPAINESRHQVITKSAQLDTEGAQGHDDLGQLVPEGYDYKLVDENARERWVCPMCHLIPRKPAKVGCSCGQIFCHACISTQTKCPMCRETIEQCMVLKHLERKIRHQQVYCVNQDKGCEWTGEVGDVPQHLQDPTNLPGTCLYQLTTCKKCDEELLHVELSDHMDSVCEHRIVRCEYQFAGCHFEGPEMNMSQHLQENTTTHLALISELVTNQMHASTLMRKKFWRWYCFTLVALVVALSIAVIIATFSIRLAAYPNIRIDDLEDTNSKLLDLVDQLNDELATQDIRIDNLVSQLDYLASQINQMKSDSFFTTIVKKVIKNTIGKFIPSGYID